MDADRGRAASECALPSTHAIAGLWNEAGNVLGMMPHPEHAVDPDLGPTGGQHVFQWLLTAARDRVPV